MIGYASDLIVLTVSAALTAAFFIYDLKGMGGLVAIGATAFAQSGESISASRRTLDPDQRVWLPLSGTGHPMTLFGAAGGQCGKRPNCRLLPPKGGTMPPVSRLGRQPSLPIFSRSRWSLRPKPWHS